MIVSGRLMSTCVFLSLKVRFSMAYWVKRFDILSQAVTSEWVSLRQVAMPWGGGGGGGAFPR